MTGDALWPRARPIFDGALQREESARAEYVRAACAGDDDLEAYVLRLLDAARADDFLSGLSGTELDRLADEAADLSGRRIGPYRLLSRLGTGGMGAVYLAERADGEFEQRVAIKLMRAGMIGEDALRRFRRERQILAWLEHPGIARIIDGGVADGTPYLVMEHVEGQPIDVHCDAAGLGVRERVRLFLSVLDAVEHAHRSLIIHRDLKPGNILVTAAGEPKLLDFGVARLLDDERFDRSATRTGGVAPFTPEYASPEQIRGDPLTTASDVYSLGCVLYRLLTGVLPHRLDGLSLAAIERKVSTEAPVRPGEIRRELRGDLETILQRALHPEAGRRYASVAELADDLQRHLDSRPVRARPDTIMYRTGRFVRRHRVGVAASAVIVLAVLTGALATAAAGRRAERHFQEVRGLANAMLFDLHGAVRSLPGATHVRRQLVAHALEYLDLLREEAPTDPALQLELASAYEQIGEIQGDPHRANLGDLAGAVGSYRRAFELRETVWRRDTADAANRHALANSYGRLAVVNSWSGRNDEAIEQSRHALALLATVDTTQIAVIGDAGRIEAELGWWLIWAARIEDGLAHINAGRDRLERIVRDTSATADNRLDLWRAYSYRVDGLRFSSRFGEALALSRDTALDYLAWLSDRYPHDPRVHHALHVCHNFMGSMYVQLGDPARAEQSLRTSLAYAELMVESDSANQKAFEALGRSYSSLGTFLLAERRLDDAVAAHERAILEYTAMAVRNPSNAELPNMVGNAHRVLCRGLENGGRSRDALASCLAGEAALERAVASNRENQVMLGNLISAMVATGRVYRSLAREAPADSAGELRERARERFESALRLRRELATSDATPEIPLDSIIAELRALARER